MFDRFTVKIICKNVTVVGHVPKEIHTSLPAEPIPENFPVKIGYVKSHLSRNGLKFLPPPMCNK